MTRSRSFAQKVLTARTIAGSVARMETQSGLVELNMAEVPAAVTSWALGYWFSFTYYASPALLVEREARMR
jgi:hypothetical protein